MSSRQRMSARWPAKSYVLTTGLHSKQIETAPGVRVGRRSMPVCYTRAVAQGAVAPGIRVGGGLQLPARQARNAGGSAAGEEPAPPMMKGALCPEL